MSPGTLAIEAVGLTRRYGEATVLDAVDLQVEQGEIVAMLGPTVRARPRWSASCPP
ncbi:MAG: hypothetical protein WCF36_15750 [Candidatus Nanopelagicales bacterium]